MAFSVTDSIDRYVEAIEEPREPDGLWHPSSFGGCERKSVYEVTGVPKSNPPDARTKRIFRVGHLMHSFVQTAISKDESVKQFFPEIRIDHPALKVTGHADGLIQYLSGDWEVLEFKTIKSTAFKFGDLPKADHIGQVALYMKVIREVGGVAEDTLGRLVAIPALGDKLTRARIIYVSKDDLQIGEYSVFWSDAKDKEIIEKLLRLESYRRSETLPPRLPENKGKRHYLCGYCPFQDTCWEDA